MSDETQLVIGVLAFTFSTWVVSAVWHLLDVPRWATFPMSVTSAVFTLAAIGGALTLAEKLFDKDGTE